MTKVAYKEKAEELVRSLENSKENYTKAKADKEAADAKLKELDTCLAETRAELTKLEAEYNELLKHYVPEQPEPKPVPKPGVTEQPQPGKSGTPGSQKTPGTTEQPKAPVQSQVNAKLKALPNTGQNENGVASVAALAALAIAARLRKAKN